MAPWLSVRLRRDLTYSAALGRALVRLADFPGATEIDPTGLLSSTMQKKVISKVSELVTALKNTKSQ